MATIALTTNFGHTETTGAPTSVATPSAAAANASDWIVGWCATSAAVGQVSNITDSINGAIPATQILFFGNVVGGFNSSIFFYYQLARSTASRTITANFSVGAHSTIIAASFSGLFSSGPLDGTGPVAHTGSGTTITTGSTPAMRFSQSGLVLAYFVADTATGSETFSAGQITVGANTSFIGLGNSTGSGNQAAFDAGYLIPTVPGQASGQITVAPTAPFLGAIVTLSDTSINQALGVMVGPI